MIPEERWVRLEEATLANASFLARLDQRGRDEAKLR